MGLEYNISFKKSAGYSIEPLLSRLDNPRDSSGWAAFTVQDIVGGIYFCDNGGSQEASIAFRRIVDEAIQQGEKVVIEEA